MVKQKMKKSVLSLAVIAALGFTSASYAGTVTTKTDTNITLYGFTQMYFDWYNNQSFLGTSASKEYSGGKLNIPAQTSFGSTANYTRLGFNLDNKAEGIKGLIEGDFKGGGANIGTDGNGNFRLRRAFFVKEFCQEGCNYTPWLLVGQDYSPGNFDVYSLNGLNNTAGTDLTKKIPQVAFGVKLDLGAAKLNPYITFEDIQGYVTSKVSQRASMPGIGIKVPVEFETGLGSPAKFYAQFQWQQTKQTYNNSDNDENSYIIGTGLELPIYAFSLKGDVYYAKAFTGFGAPTDKISPPSFYLNGNSLEKVSSTGWALQAKVDFNKLAQVPISIAGGYSQIIYGNLTTLSSSDYARKAATVYANLAYNLTKSASLGLEYDRNITYYVGSKNDPNHAQYSNQVFLVGTYKF
ncbi:MAG: hypothetical protein ACP5SC_05355 [Desulfurella sp.]